MTEQKDNQGSEDKAPTTEDNAPNTEAKAPNQIARERMGGESQKPSAPPPGEGKIGAGSFSQYLHERGFSPRAVILMVAGFAGIAFALIIFFFLMGPHAQKGVPIVGPPPVAQRLKPADPGGLKVDPSLNPKSDSAPAAPVEAPEQPNLEGLANYGHGDMTPPAPPAPETAAPPALPAPQPAPVAPPVPPTSLRHQDHAVHLGQHEEERLREPHVPDFQVQLAAERNDEDAKRNWANIQKAHPALVAQKTPHIVPAQLGGATIYRLRLSGFASHKKAAHFCHLAHMQQVTCFVVH